jgi:amino acid transporter
MAEATQKLARCLDWRSGAFLALTPILGVLTTVGWMVGLVGAWAVIFIWTVSMVLAVAQAFLYAEMATMFPEQTGGVAAYAHEGLRKYTVFVGPVAMWGYWLGWTLVQAVIAFILGSIIQEMWFPASSSGRRSAMRP